MGLGHSIYNSFRFIIEPLILPFFKDIDKYLRKAGIKKDILEYVGEVFFYSLLIAFAFSFLGALIGFMISIFILNRLYIILIVIPAATLFLVGFTIGIVFFRSYPNIIISSRARKIDNCLYLATMYMASMASSGANPLSLFELLSRYKEFSEISKEASDIVTMVKALGISLPRALYVKANDSPSKGWKELLEGIRSIIVEGGDLESFLYEKAAQYIQEFRRKLIEYTNSLQVFLEIYITLVVVGIIFVLVLTTLLGSVMGGGEAIKDIQLMLILILLPAATIMFILFIKSINPFES